MDGGSKELAPTKDKVEFDHGGTSVRRGAAPTSKGWVIVKKLWNPGLMLLMSIKTMNMGEQNINNSEHNVKQKMEVMKTSNASTGGKHLEIIKNAF